MVRCLVAFFRSACAEAWRDQRTCLSYGFLLLFFFSSRKDGVVILDAGINHGTTLETEPSLPELASLYPGVRRPDSSDWLSTVRRPNIDAICYSVASLHPVANSIV